MSPRARTRALRMAGGRRRLKTPRDSGPRPTWEVGQRLQKVMAAAGIGSRRHCEELIMAGRVEVDRQVVTRLGTRVAPARQEVRVDGTPLARPRRVYYLVNKPPGVVSTSYDPSGRPRVIDLVPNVTERLFTVGRLDLASEGLMLVTNDGQLAQELAHPRYGVEKTYHVLVAGAPAPDVLAKLRQGVRLAEGPARVERVRIKTEFKQSTLLEIVLAEGRNREIRRLLARLGHKVLRLKRVALGGVRLKDLAPGQFRRLRGEELGVLRARARAAARPAGDADVKRSAARARQPGRRPERGPDDGASTTASAQHGGPNRAAGSKGKTFGARKRAHSGKGRRS